MVFSLPGAYTPTCSSRHLPRYNELADVLKANGVSAIVCLSVNDAFVMNEWKRDQEALIWLRAWLMCGSEQSPPRER